jgi:hypothetical protein
MAQREEYIDYMGVELKTIVRCNGCDEDLPFDSDGHDCEWSADLDADDKVYVMDPADLYQNYMESLEEDEGCGYDRYRDQLGIDY